MQTQLFAQQSLHALQTQLFVQQSLQVLQTQPFVQQSLHVLQTQLFAQQSLHILQTQPSLQVLQLLRLHAPEQLLAHVPQLPVPLLDVHPPQRLVQGAGGQGPV